MRRTLLLPASMALAVLLASGVALAAVEVTTYYKAVDKWGSYGTADGQFAFPSGIAIDSQGNVYVADTSNNRIQKFTSSGQFITKWGTTGTGNGQFDYPSGIAVDPQGNVYVADQGNNRVQKFTSGGQFITKWGTTGTGDGQFQAPRGIAVDPQGNVYVADISNANVQKFTSSGQFIDKWGTPGTGNGQFDRPWGIAVDPQGNVYVVEDGSNRVQKFTSDGQFIAKWGSYGSGNGQFGTPLGIAVDSQGNVFVGEWGNHRIQKFTSSGQFITKWGSYGTADGRFDGPFGITVGASGNVYVADFYNNRVQKFAEVPLESDTTAPTTHVSISPESKRGINNSTVSVSLNAVDAANGSGVQQITYEATGAQPLPSTTVQGASTELTISAAGKTNITYSATDLAGNIETPPKSKTVTIDKTPPRVKSTTPQNRATRAPPSTVVTAVFSERIGGAKLLRRGYMRLYKLNKQGSTVVPIAATLKYDAETKKARLVPSAPLKAGATYRAMVSWRVQDLADNYLDQSPHIGGTQSKIWRFTVAN